MSLSCCTQLPDGAPLVKLTLQGAGENLLRMEKRLHCAAVAVGVRIVLTVEKQLSLLGVDDHSNPVVFYQNNLLMQGLMRTEEIEQRLHQLKMNNHIL